MYSILIYQVKKLTFNEEKEDLKCLNLGRIKRCTVDINHFERKKSDYYNIKYDGYNNEKVIVYEVNPIKAILPNSDTNKNNKNNLIIILLIAGSTVFIIIIIVFLIIKRKKKKDNLEDELGNLPLYL